MLQIRAIPINDLFCLKDNISIDRTIGYIEVRDTQEISCSIRVIHLEVYTIDIMLVLSVFTC